MEQENGEEEQTNPSLLNSPFTQGDLERVWHQYAETEDDVHLKNTMLNVKPQLQENNLIVVWVYNPDQQNKLWEKGDEIKQFLFQQFQNNQLSLDIRVTENKKEFIPYTNRDKFDYMVEKNPTLLNLVRDFNLRLD